ncbi:restriction endonuclease [Acuticoccus sediminis]|uniref:Restriction endonuclease n=1 Tax=Acuticoccus sediminis TaxID=2184697 RepID=A0A8B2NFU8_9HYPH|nr:restriction endonuclease [Acuticoccus sediminis]RAH95649.1 restriction endonuclease [Acuticoccus sediminis]
MSHRTVQEWGSLRYGSGDDEVPRAALDPLAAVARHSSAGPAFELHRDRLRARQVVGVVATRAHSLEILPKIDFADPDPTHRRTREQLVHMLAVAHDLDVASGEIASLGRQHETLLELLVGLFARRLVVAVRHGRPRRYVRLEEDLPQLRGRLDAKRQFSVLAANPQRLASIHDELSPDIALNRIMKATIACLARLSRSAANRRLLRELQLIYEDVEDVAVPALRWGDVVLDRTSTRWRGLLALARQLLRADYQTTSAGAADGITLLFDMNVLFEAYVARLVRGVWAGPEVAVVAQGGRRFCLIDADERGRFQTKPDILVRDAQGIVAILDTKWKRLASRLDEPKQKVAQSDVYQMVAYARVYGCPDVVLVYPHHAGMRSEVPTIRHFMVTGSHDRLTIATVDVRSHDAARQSLRHLAASLRTPRPMAEELTPNGPDPVS